MKKKWLARIGCILGAHPLFDNRTEEQIKTVVLANKDLKCLCGKLSFEDYLDKYGI